MKRPAAQRHDLALDNWARSPRALYHLPQLFALVGPTASSGQVNVCFWPPERAGCWCGVRREHGTCELPAHKVRE